MAEGFKNQAGHSTFATVLPGDGSGTPTASDYAILVHASGVTFDGEIGAVELKNGTTDARAIINAANTARTSADHVLLVQTVGPNGDVATSGPKFIEFTPTSISAVGASTVFDNRTYACDKGSVQYTVTGAPVALSLQWQGSNDNVNWLDIGDPFTSLSGDGGTFSDACYKYFRFYMNTLTANNAVGTMTFAGGIPVLDDTFTIGTQVFTWKAARGGAGEVTLGADEAACVTNAVVAITADIPGLVTAIDGTGDTVTVTALALGALGNSVVFSESSSNLTMDGAGFLGGTVAGQDPLVAINTFLRT